MDKKFMTIKKFIIPVMTIVVMTSQLMGCASVSSDEMLELLQAGESVEIEVAMPSYYEAEQGEEVLSDWTELGLQENYKEYRVKFDDVTYTHSAGEVGKNGPMYVDLEGNWTNNSTFYYAMMNKVFVEKYWNDTDTKEALREAILETYVDIDESDSARLKDTAIINAYFSLFADNEEAYMNPNSTLTRGEFLAGLAKADTPVDKELTASPEMLAAVGSETSQVILAELTEADSYLNLKDKSLDAVTFNGTISKAEAVYTIVQRYFSEEYSKVTGKEEAYADTKNAGNIASRAGFINEEEGTYPDKWKAYTLSSMLQNPDKGMDESFYKAYVVAKQQGLVTGSDTNYDEAITKAEAIDLILKAYEAIADRDGYATNHQDGLNEGEALNRGDSTEVGTPDYSGGAVDINGNPINMEDIVEGTALTQAEIDEYNATHSMKYNAEDGTVTSSSSGRVYEAVGQPGDTSWHRMDPEDAKEILAKGDPNVNNYSSPEEYKKAIDEYMAADAEVNGFDGSDIGGKWYYDYYEWVEAKDEAAGRNQQMDKETLESHGYEEYTQEIEWAD